MEQQSWIETDTDIRCFSLLAAVIHHGLSNLADNAVPSRADTVLQTAKAFEAYVKTGTADARPSNGRNKGGKAQ